MFSCGVLISDSRFILTCTQLHNINAASWSAQGYVCTELPS